MTRHLGWALWALALVGCGTGSDDGPEVGVDGDTVDAVAADAGPVDAAPDGRGAG
jgi:hypothetical protein